LRQDLSGLSCLSLLLSSWDYRRVPCWNYTGLRPYHTDFFHSCHSFKVPPCHFVAR
jgi:hypothetical protein